MQNFLNEVFFEELKENLKENLKNDGRNINIGDTIIICGSVENIHHYPKNEEKTFSFRDVLKD